MGKKKPAGHYCRICGRRRANEKFGRRGHALHICKDCQRELKCEARQKRKAGETDAVVLELEEDLMDMNEDDLEWMLDQPLTTPSAKSTGKKGIPYDELDANIVRLVQALNRYPGVMTVGSCGGHETIINPSQWQAGTWYVKFTLPSGKFGWYLLEHLAWVVNEDYRGSGRNVMLLPTSAPPYLNTVGQCLYFVIEGYGGENPDELAEFLDATRKYLTKKRR
jgi:hypothetical protein